MKDETTLSVAVMSGKGGVGKSNIALNLGYALSQAGYPLLLMDCDLGLANLDVLLGIAPEGNLQQVIMDERAASDIIYPISEKGRGYFDILPAASGVPELAEMDADMRDLLLRRLEPELRKYSAVLLDLGAGINGTVRSFAAMAAVRLLVMTPEPTSLTDSYSLLKALHRNPNFAKSGTQIHVVANRVNSVEDGQAVYDKLNTVVSQFLNGNLEYLGMIPQDSMFEKAIRQQQIVSLYAPETKSAKAFEILANNLIEGAHDIPLMKRGFAQLFAEFFNNR